MAKVNARGAYEVASVVCERRLEAGVAYNGSPAELYRSKFVLRSDGAVLSKVLWVQPDDGERRTHSSAYSLWNYPRKVKADRRNRETLVAMLVRHGHTVITEATLALERKATAQAAADKRKASLGPEGSAAHWAALHAVAHAAGMVAGRAYSPTPMVVVEHANPLDDSSPVVAAYGPIMDGPCGSAYVTVRPANGSFGKWAAFHGWRPAHGGGLMCGVAAFGQSVERSGAYAMAYAEVLRTAGVSAYGSTWIN